MFLSLPCSVGEQGITNIVRMRITEYEKKLFQTSANVVFNVQKGIKAVWFIFLIICEYRSIVCIFFVKSIVQYITSRSAYAVFFFRPLLVSLLLGSPRPHYFEEKIKKEKIIDRILRTNSSAIQVCRFETRGKHVRKRLSTSRFSLSLSLFLSAPLCSNITFIEKIENDGLVDTLE